MAKRPLVPPFGGRSDSDALYTQPGFTTKSTRNVRGRDPVTGRIRIAQRAGLTRFNASALGTGKVKALCSTTIDDRKVTYSFTAGTETVPWSTATPSKTDSLGIVTDRQGNVYALDGNAGVAKYNSAGKLLMKVALPVADPAHVVRALFVDDSDRIFAGVSAGGDVRTARVFCVLQRPQPGVASPDDSNQYFILWQFEPGAYTEELKVYRGSQLYCAHNYTLERRARVIVYEGIGLEPIETKRIESLAYPINGLDLLGDGTMYTVAPPVTGFIFRPCHPAVQRFNAPLVGWTPNDLTDAHTRIWAWYDARDIDETDVEQTGAVATLQDGQQILRWRDRSGNGRHFFAGNLAVVGEAGPTYVRAGIGGLPSVHFTNLGSVKQSLVTFPNPSIEAALASQQRSAIPTYKGSQFCLFMLVRFSQDADAGTPSPRTILAQENEHATASDHVLFANRACQAPPLPGAVTAGHISYAAVTDNTGDAGQCAGPTPEALSINLNTIDIQVNGTALITMLWDGGVDPNDSGATRTRCLFRVNGRPIDRFEGLPLESLQPTWLGASPTTIFAAGMDVARRLNGEIAEMVVLVRKGFTLTTEPKVLSFDALETGSPSTPQTDCELARIEAYIAYGWGCGEQLIAANAAGFNHFYSVGVVGGSFTNGELLGPPAPAVGGLYAAHKAVLCADGLVTKHDSQGVLRAAVNMAFEGSTADTIGGIGYGVRARKVESDGKTHVWTVGPDSILNPNFPGNVALRKLIDLGASLSTSSADGAWLYKFTGNRDYDYQYPRMAADAFGNLYLPYFETGAAAEWSILVFKRDGSAGLAQVLVDFLLSANQQAHAVAIPPDALNPDYRTDLATKLAELVYIATRNESVAANSTVHKLLLVVTTSDATGSPRTVVTIGVIEDDIKTIDATTIATPSGGSGAVDATSQYVEAFQADREIVVLDGLNYKVYSPLTGLVTTLESTSAGEIPPRFKLGCIWRHRLVLARAADKPGRYCASAIGNIRDWDFRREPRLSTMAFDASLTRAGEVEDSIVALIPYSDDLLFVLGESRILRLTGDPQAGGQIDKVTDDLGGSFGRSWCKDQSGRVFMWGNPPGLYLLTIDGLEPLTRYTIEDTEFATVDYSTHRIELAWDPIQKGVHIFRVPHGAGGVLKTGWFWEEKTHRLVQGGAIWTDSYASAGLQPTAATFLAGDSTRALLLGCEDGRVRMVDPAAVDDDGEAIDSFVVLGPLNDVTQMLEWRLISTQVALANDQSGCRIELFATEEPEDIGPILRATDLSPGLNDPFRGRVRGNYIWARLRSALAGRRWALERGEVEIVATATAKNVST
jgi:hypothetical protein